MTENEISYIIRRVIFKVYKELGPGLLESVYQAVLARELMKAGLDVRVQVPISISYDNLLFEAAYRIDLLVENKVIIEVKSVDKLHDVHHKQVLTYLKLSKLKLGLLVNFNSADIANEIVRKVNSL